MSRVIYVKRVSDKNLRSILKRIAVGIGKTVRVHSGDRGRIVKGSSSGSLHLRHRAADFHILGISDKNGHRWLSQNYSDIFDVDEAYEMIHHGPHTGTGGEHLHLGRYGSGRKGYIDFKVEGLTPSTKNVYRKTRVSVKNSSGATIKESTVSGVSVETSIVLPPVGIFDSVGLGGKNNPNDVRLIQVLLNRSAQRLKEAGNSFAGVQAIVESGSVDAATIRAIYIFQRDVLKVPNPDSRVDPGAKTIRALYAVGYGSTEKILDRLGRIRTIPEPNELSDFGNEWNGVLAWGAYKNSHITDAFIKKTIKICKELGIKNPGWLMSVMAFETGRTFSPSKKNAAGSSGTGLIQFMKATIDGRTRKGRFYPGLGRKLGIKHSDLARMSAIRQLDVVKAYFQDHGSKVRRSQDVDDLYFLVLLPSAWGKPDNAVMFRGGTTAYKQNKGLDKDGDKNVSVAETAGKIRAMHREGLTKYGLRIQEQK